MNLPKFVEFHEEGPREGFQIEPTIFDIKQRIQLIEAIAESGISQIQVASFVNPKRVPQMADAPELFAGITKRPGTKYTGLWLNEQGFEKARSVPQVDLEGTLYFYASDAFSVKNNGCSANEMRDRQRDWVQRYREAGIPIKSAYIMTAFGCHLEGAISEEAIANLASWLADLQQQEGFTLPNFYLADTVGWATPPMITRRVDLMRQHLPEARIGLHLHDTRGAGAANFYAALQSGVDLFDASVAGLGGCPFSGSANSRSAGNICTEDMVFMCHEMGIETGIDLDKLIEAAQLAEHIIGRPLPGRIMHSGSLNKHRNL